VTPRARILAVVGAAALLAAAVAVLAARQGIHDGAAAKRPGGRPSLQLDLGVRTDAEARALRHAAQLYAAGNAKGAREVARHYTSIQAQVTDAFAGWPAGTLARLQALAAIYPESSFVQLHLGLAEVWSGDNAAAVAAFRRAAKLQPDTQASVTAIDLLNPATVPRNPVFEPSFGLPKAVARLAAPQQLAALRARARGSDWRAKIRYGLALDALGRRISAERQFAAAARLAPNDPEAQTAAAVGRFDKRNPSAAFSRLGPLARRFPHAATVRFHLGLLLLWIEQVKQAKVELQKAVAAEPRSPLARQARLLLKKLK
jgi:tetratricopeptide (TPR) repeat protein